MRLVTALLLLCAVVPAVAQRTDFERERVPMANLAGPWRFHTGDNPGWAAASVDDSSWSLLAVDKPWAEQGYRGYTGVAWYRLAVTLPEHPGSLAIYIPQVQESYQVFANGRLLGQSGACLRMRALNTSSCGFSPSRRMLSLQASHWKLLCACGTGREHRGDRHPAAL